MRLHLNAREGWVDRDEKERDLTLKNESNFATEGRMHRLERDDFTLTRSFPA
jgi:hypothetical protein